MSSWTMLGSRRQVFLLLALGACSAPNGASAPPRPDKARLATLAAAVRAGELESVTVAEPAPLPTARREQLAASLVTLHDVLTTAQRRELVVWLKKDLAGHGLPQLPKDDLGARVPPPVHALLSNLDLSAEQKVLITSAFESRDPEGREEITMRVQVDAMSETRAAKLETFASEVFDARAFVLPPPRPEALATHDPLAYDLALVTKVLTTEQREKVAHRLLAGEVLAPPPR
jgi:hypothetical protein